MKINNHDTKKEVYLIAEIGNNHEGDFEVAKDMVHAASECGVNAVKFQTIIPERLIHKSNPERIKQLSKFQFNQNEFERLASISKSCGVDFLTTPFSEDSIDWIAEIVPAIKISSGDNNYLPLIEKACTKNLPVIISTGMMSSIMLENLMSFISRIFSSKKRLNEAIALLHCVSNYPTSENNANLNSILSLSSYIDTIGYSDHVKGIEASVIAAAIGAQIIEKHFTLDKTKTSFGDHALSADPSDMKEIVDKLSLIRALKGKTGILVSQKEKENEKALRRGIYASRKINKGEVLKSSDFNYLRPQEQLSASEGNSIVGLKAVEDIDISDEINYNLLFKRNES